MPAVNVIIPQLQGVVATLGITATGGGRALEPINAWLEACEEVMRIPSNAILTDWEFAGANNVLPASGGAIRTGASTVYGLLIEYNSNRAERSDFVIYDNTGQTYDATAVIPITVMSVFQPAATATNLVSEYSGIVWPMGIPMATGIQLAADGRAGTDPIANTFRAWILYRSA